MSERDAVDEVQGHFVHAAQLSVVPTAGSLVPLGDWSLLVDVRDAVSGRVDVVDDGGHVVATSPVVRGAASLGVGDTRGTLTVRYVDDDRVLTQQVTLPS